MKKELEILVKLQSLDSLLVTKEEHHGGVATAIKEATAEVAVKQDVVANAEDRLNTLEKERRDKESAMEDLAQRVTDRKGKLFQVKDNKEYTAMLKEIEQAKAKIDRYEEEVIVLLDDILAAQEELEKANEDLVHARKHLEDAQREGEREHRRLEREFAQIKEERQRFASNVPSKFIRLYERIRSGKNGVAVVRTETSICRGCNMEIPPQHFLEVKKGEEILQCPFCQRILYYWEEEVEE